MGMKFRKSFKIAPGVKVNFNKKSTSVTLGGKGIHHTVSSTGKRTTSAGIPGSGLYYTKSSGGGSRSGKSSNTYTSSGRQTPDPNREKWYQKTGWIIFFLIILAPVGFFLMWKYKKDWGKNLKIILTVIFSIWFIAILVAYGSDQEKEPPKTTSVVSESKETVPLTTEAATEAIATTESSAPETAPVVVTTEAPKETEPQTEYVQKVWVNSTGAKYHRTSSCSGMKGAYEVTIDEAKSMGKEACGKCY